MFLRTHRALSGFFFSYSFFIYLPPSFCSDMSWIKANLHRRYGVVYGFLLRYRHRGFDEWHVCVVISPFYFFFPLFPLFEMSNIKSYNLLSAIAIGDRKGTLIFVITKILTCTKYSRTFVLGSDLLF